MFKRFISTSIQEILPKGKVILLIGPRQVGKTTLIKNILQDQDHIFFDGDDPTTQTLLEKPDTEKIKRLIGNHNVVYMDEAQRFKGIGLTLKIIADQLQGVQAIASGSSALELRSLLEEPLTGRKRVFSLYPLSWSEFENHVGMLKGEQELEHRLIYGMYPEVVDKPEDQDVNLKELVNSYLYKDVLALGTLQIPDALQALLKALAYQVGQEVSYNELSRHVGLDAKTVRSYMDLLEQAYIIFRLKAFSGNLQNEIRKGQKVYFYDNGVRNALIGDLRPLDIRQDVGQIWENFLVSERKKTLEYSNSDRSSYFWRTRQQQEVDYVEVLYDKVEGFEFKWNPNRKPKLPRNFGRAYDTEIQVVTRANFREFLELK